MNTRDIALWEAVAERNLPRVRSAILAGANVHSTDDRTGKTLLHEAAHAGSLDVFRYIFENGADISRPRRAADGSSRCGPRPIHYAVRYNRYDIVQFIIRSGCDVNVIDDQGYSALHIAVKWNYIKLVQLLLDAGADTNATTLSGDTLYDLMQIGEKSRHELDNMINLVKMYELKRLNKPQYRFEDDRNGKFEGRMKLCGTPRMQRLGALSIRPTPMLGKHEVENTDQFELRSAVHSMDGATQNVGNVIGTKSSVRQSKYFRMYESGNTMKSMLGQDSLVWDINRKQGAYKGPVYDAERSKY